MDLALHMGMTADGLSRSMTERELGDWQRYAARRMLPQRRIELYLAQLALVTAKAMGGAKDATLQDFLFDPEEDEAPAMTDEEIAIDDIVATFGGTVYRKGAA